MSGRRSGPGISVLAVLAGCSAFHEAEPDAGLREDVQVDVFAPDVGERGFVQVSAVGNTTCALRHDGLAACWGAAFLEEPLVREGPYQQVSAGRGHACFLRDGAAIECFVPDSNPLADRWRNVPDGVFVELDIGLRSCAIRVDGTVVCWGSADGEFLPPPTDEPLSNLAVGWWACGLTPEAAPVCWMLLCCIEPPEVPEEALQQVKPSRSGICGLTLDSEVECWSTCETWLEAMGDPPPGPFDHLSVSNSISACALRPGGELECWGSSYDFGDQEPEGLRYRDVAIGSRHVCAITLEGELVCWGSNEWNQAPHRSYRREACVPAPSLSAARPRRIRAHPTRACANRQVIGTAGAQ